MCLSWFGFFPYFLSFSSFFVFLFHAGIVAAMEMYHSDLTSRKPSLTRAVSWQTSASTISELTAVFKLRTHFPQATPTNYPAQQGVLPLGHFSPAGSPLVGNCHSEALAETVCPTTDWNSPSPVLSPSATSFSHVSPTSQSEDFPPALPTINFVHFWLHLMSFLGHKSFLYSSGDLCSTISI